MKTLYNKMGHGGRMKYAGGGRMSNKRLARMLAKYMMGGKMKMEHGGKHYRHGGAHDSSGRPILNPFDDSEFTQTQRRQQERSMIDEGLMSKPGEGVTIAFGEESPVDFETVRRGYMEKNPDLVNPKKDFFMVGDERVFIDAGDDDQFERLVRNRALDRDVSQTQGDTYTSIFRDLMSEFDNYVAGFGDEVRNDPEQIQKMRDKFAEEARNYAGQIFESRGR
tara:strand:+ start:1285 stop:1950 length:666 start_codon:yes stop_codon:yes gene_type:complete